LAGWAVLDKLRADDQKGRMSCSEPTILLLTPDPGWGDDADEIAHQLALLRDLGLDCATRPWTAAGDLTDFALVTPLMAWGYHQHPAAWNALLDTAAALRLANPVSILRWNGDKAYLGELAGKGVDIVPTQFVDELEQGHLAEARLRFDTDDLVIKPPVSAGADGTYLLRDGALAPDASLGQRMLIQPMIPAITTEGEFSLFLFGGRYSHAVLKTPRSGDFRVQAQFGGTDVAVDPPAAAKALAEAALAAAPEEVLYARVDMVRDSAGMFRLMELELIEPYLWLDRAPDGGAHFVALLREAAERGRGSESAMAKH